LNPDPDPAPSAQPFIFVIIASIQASEGKLYRYPLSIRLIS